MFSTRSWVRNSTRIAARSSVHVFVGVISVLLFCRFSLLQGPDEVLYARHFPQSATPDRSIVLIDIDEATVDHYGVFPWNRQIWASMIRRLSQYRPKLIAIDVLFDAERDAEGDQAFARAVS